MAVILLAVDRLDRILLNIAITLPVVIDKVLYQTEDHSGTVLSELHAYGIHALSAIDLACGLWLTRDATISNQQ